MSAACRGREDGPTASPSTTTTNPEAPGHESPKQDSANSAGGVNVEEVWRAHPYVMARQPDPPQQTGNTQVSFFPAAAPAPRTYEEASNAAASATTPSSADNDAAGRPASNVPYATEGGAVHVGSAVGSEQGGVAAGASIFVVGRYLDAPNEAVLEDVEEGDSLEIGREPGTAFEHDVYMERYHAALTPTMEGIIVEDLGTQNGVFLRITSPTPIDDGDQFRVGEELLAIRLLSQLKEPGNRAVGCPDPGYWARIDMLLRPDLAAASYPVDDGEASVGREDGNIQFPDDPYVSAEHCRIRSDHGTILLEDLVSEHGTFVRLKAQQVVPYGSTLLIGQTLIRADRAR